MIKEINSKAIEIDNDLVNDLNHIMENSSDVTPFMKLFWDQQKEASMAKSMKYHPMIIQFCLSLASKSASAYDELRSSKVLTLPSRRPLRDYKNAIKPSPGFNPEVINELTKLALPLKDHQRFVCVSFDEMKVQENLVFDKSTNKLVGFVDLGDPDLNYASFQDNDTIAKYAFVFYVRGIASDLKFSLAYFATVGVSAYHIMSLSWEAVSYLELTCNLHVVACVSDGATPNRRFYKMHRLNETDLTYKAQNPFCEERFVFFFADAPHLLKTLRNCMHHSGYGKKPPD